MDEFESDDERLLAITDNCDQVRRKIRAYLNAGESKIGEFQGKIGVSPQAYARFMGQSGPEKGSGCLAYMQAHMFFKKRELLGLSMPKKKKPKKADSAALKEVSAVQLDGEDDQSVPVYDSCDEVRKKINAYLRSANCTQAAFLREVASAYPEGKKIQSKQLQDFLGRRGAASGNTSSVFYGSYVFFEKMRLKDGKPKSKHRNEMEMRHPLGFDVETVSNGYYIMPVDYRPTMNEYGQMGTVRVGH